MDLKGKGKDIQPPPLPKEPVTNATDIVDAQPIPPQQQQQQPSLPPLVPVTNPTDIVGPQQQQQQVKKKRGRPRKHARDGGVGETKPPAKRSEEPVLIPQTIGVNKGEDIKSKVLAFTGEEQRTVWIISGTGAVSTATLSPGVTYEGRYNIVTLKGSFTNKVVDGSIQKSIQLSVSLAGLDGLLVVGGNVDGPLIAATQVQVVVGSIVNAIDEIGGDNVEGLDPEAASAPANTSNSQGQSSELTDDIETQQPRQ